MKISVVASSYISSNPIRFYQPVQADYYTLGDHNLRFKADATQEDRHRYLQMQAHTLAPFSAHDILIITSLPMEIHAEGLELIKQTLKTKRLVYSYGGDVIAFKPSDTKFTKALNKAYQAGLSLENFLDGFEKENGLALELPLVSRTEPKMIIGVVVYNRIRNIEKWLQLWDKCSRDNVELVVIHNADSDLERANFENLCTTYGVKYIPRKNVGFDIGAFQDVCLERLLGFPNDWDTLLWCTDDMFPTKIDFYKPYAEKLKNQQMGAACTEISSEVAEHIRTNGFAISKYLSKQLHFPASKVITKEQCYHFEHQGGNKTLINQIRNLGLLVELVDTPKTAPLWDSEHRSSWNRFPEIEKAFNEPVLITLPRIDGDKVVFICPIYNRYPEILSSMICQTHQNWELHLIHDGPCDFDLKGIVTATKDERIKYYEQPKKRGKWGHYYRKWALEQIKNGAIQADYVVITNGDNHHVPAFTELLLAAIKAKPQHAVASYCSQMVHSYLGWVSHACRLEYGHIDCAGVMVRADVASEIGWRNTHSHSGDWTYFSDIIKKYGVAAFEKRLGCFLVHN